MFKTIPMATVRPLHSPPSLVPHEADQPHLYGHPHSGQATWWDHMYMCTAEVHVCRRVCSTFSMYIHFGLGALCTGY